MPLQLPQDRMPEAEVALRLVFYLLSLPGSTGSATVAIDGAQVQCGKTVIFPLLEFMADQGWRLTEPTVGNSWQGSYQNGSRQIRITARSGEGDVTAVVGNTRVVAECKKGSLIRRPSNQEYPLLREAIGQLVTSGCIREGDVPVAAVPDTDAFRRRALDFRQITLFNRTGIQIVLVNRNGSVHGLKLDLATEG